MQALIDTDRYSDALAWATAHPKDTSPLALAYVYYKLDMSNVEDMHNQFNNSTSSSTARAYKHILAQHYYRRGDCKQALALYQDLIASASTENSPYAHDLADLAVNYRAVAAHLQLYNDDDITIATDAAPSADTTYDLLFNDAFMHIVNGNLDAADDTLDKALQQARAANADSEDIDPILVQKGYIALLRGDNDDAYEKLSQLSVNSPQLQVVLSHNLVAAVNQLIENPYLLHRELQLPASLNKVSSSMTNIQNDVLKRNAKALIANENNSITQTLIKCQRLVNSGNNQAAISLIESLKNSSSNPLPIGISSVLIALYETEGCVQKLRKFLDESEPNELIELKKLSAGITDVKIGVVNDSNTENNINELVKNIDIKQLNLDDFFVHKVRGVSKSTNKIIKETPIRWIAKRDRPGYRGKKNTQA